MATGPHTDTTPEVLALQVEAWRGMTPAARVWLACELSEAARALLRSRLRAEHPDSSDRDIAAAMARAAQAAVPGTAPWR